MDSSNLINTRLGKYEIQAEIGRGGMAVVYKGYDPTLDRYVAVKVLAPHLVWEGDFVERFLREARAAARLKHPAIVTIYDVGQEENWYYFVMEYLEGQPLTEVIRQQGPFPPDEALSILRPLAEALDYAHHRELVHRDIKPSNVIVSPEGRVTLTDFGIARVAQETRLTVTGTLIGTPEYMSPEQAKGLTVEARSDQYSLGVVAYEMLSGRAPFQAESTLALMYKVVHEPPPPIRQARPDLPASVEGVLAKALAKEPEERFESAGAFAQALERTVAGEPVERWAAEPPTRMVARPKVMEPRPRTVPAWVWGLGAAAVALITGILLALASVGRQSTPVVPVPTGTPHRTRTSQLMRTTDIGRSVQGHDLSMAVIGDTSDSAIVIVGSIQGDQTNTRDLTNSLIDYFNQYPQRVPDGVAFYFILSLNPDGNATNSRYNANGVDLNRNWDTADWRSKAAAPGYPEGKSGTGGSHPFSEPETRAAADFLSGLKSQGRNIRVVVLHSSVRRTQGEVYPGGDDALEIARRYASAAGYDVESQWAEYTTSGEMVTWCTEQGITSIDVVIPSSQRPSSSVPGMNNTLLDLTVQALLEIAVFP